MLLSAAGCAQDSKRTEPSKPAASAVSETSAENVEAAEEAPQKPQPSRRFDDSRISTLYDVEFSYTDPNGNKDTYFYEVPQIDDDTEGARNINEMIGYRFGYLVERALDARSRNDFIDTSYIIWVSNWDGPLLSLQITSSDAMYNHDVGSYHYNFATGQELSNPEMLAHLGYTDDAKVMHALERAVAQHFDTYYGYIDPDQTAMVLQALAPYRTQADVSAAIDRALNVLSGMQKDDGSFDAWGASSSESISQVLVALCALGIDPAKDSRFVRASGAWLVSALMSFRVQTETGLAFGHTNRTANYMATEQAGYALAAYERFLAGQPALYTMTDTTYGTHTCVRYRDTARHWAQPYVCAVTEQGLMNGVGNDCFDPEGTLNRAMLATILWRASGSPAADGGSFSDVPAGQWYSTAVSWAQQSGIVQGVGENRFAPMDSITREQLAVMLWRASGSPGSTQSLAAFPDAGTCSDWASTALAWAVERGILNGMDGRLAPGGTATRAQAAAMLTRYLQ